MRGMKVIAFVVLVTAMLKHALGSDTSASCFEIGPTGGVIPCSETYNNAHSCSSVELHSCWFPRGFHFGTASSAYQYEGAHNVDGKGQSIWDTFMHEHPEKISDHSNGDIAADHYRRYKEDIALMKGMGMDAFRFSISWPRVLPNGRISGGVNHKGLIHYNNVINEIKRQGMEPFVTIFHWDVPQALEFEYGGFLNESIVQDYQDYAELLFDTFGDRVKYWITFNEPSIFTTHGYDLGDLAPGRCSNCTYGDSGREPYRVAHNQLLAHAAAVDLYRKKYKYMQRQQIGQIGITLECDWMVPNSASQGDLEAKQRALDFKLGWFMDPITNGDYPDIMKHYVKSRLPKFTPEEQKLLKGSIDFLGLNYYTANYVADVIDKVGRPESYSFDSMVVQTTEKGGKPIGDRTGAPWLFVYPQGLRDILVYIKRQYDNPAIYITENGVADSSSLTVEETLEDTQRKEYYCSHLHYLLRAISEGVHVRGYFAWTFLDVLEWSSGYTNRFGLVYVDNKNHLQRYKKQSARWFQEFLKPPPHECPRPKPIHY